MKTLLLLAVALTPCLAMAENCKEIGEDAARLACWDKLAAVEEKPTPTVRDPKSWPFGANTGPISPAPVLPNWHVREKLNAPYEDGKAISLSLTNSSGDRVLKTNAAFVYELGSNMFSDSWQRAGWSAWLGAQWTKDSAAKKPVDGRLWRLVAMGTSGSDHNVITMLALDFAQDNVSKTKTVGFRPEIMPVTRFTESGTAYSKEGAYSAYIKYGAQFDRVKLGQISTGETGNAAGLNAKVNLSYYPGGQIAPLHFFFDAVRARDLYAGASISKRTSTFYDFGAEWMFTRPDKKAGSVTPTLSLHRVIGNNFLIGAAPTVQTVLSVGLKVN